MKPTRPRLRKPMAEVVQRYTASVGYDQRLAKHDIAGSIAHARMLGKQAIIPDKEAVQIIAGLIRVQEELQSGAFALREDLEDIHMNVEARLTDHVGDIAGKLHTARSRNDQIALDMRMFVKEATSQAIDGLRELQGTILDQAGAHVDTIMPGYTHLQRAQPVLLAHHLLAYFEMFQRDIRRFRGCHACADVLPLGSGALAGAPYALDRAFVARELGFARISENSMDAVSDRDFVVEYHAAASTSMMHVSRLAEEIILWSTTEFGFLELDDAYATGSSIMPQKKNPDVAELARGRTGRVYGNLMAALTTMKGLPLAYNRDLQEDKEPLFDSVDTLNATLSVLAGLLVSCTFNGDRTFEAASTGFLLATDWADYLVAKGVPFRQAHAAAGAVVQHAADSGKEIGSLTLEDFRPFSPEFDVGVLAITLESSISSRDHLGGVSPLQVKEALERARKVWADDQD